MKIKDIKYSIIKISLHEKHILKTFLKIHKI